MSITIAPIGHDPRSLAACYLVMRELRPHVSLENFMALVHEAAQRDGYKLVVALDQNENMVGVVGYRLMYDLVHGKHIYVDDLVTSEAHRSKGIGALLLTYAEKEAQQLGCSGLRLCTGIDNDRGKTFYARNGWNLRAVVYKKKF